MSEPKLRQCILCDEPTTGSIGAAGYRWASICQPCKDKEDRALAARVTVLAQTLRRLTDTDYLN